MQINVINVGRIYLAVPFALYRKSKNFHCKNIFLVAQGYENKYHEIFSTANKLNQQNIYGTKY